MNEEQMATPVRLNQFLDANRLPDFIRYVHACSHERLRLELQAIVVDRELSILGRLVALVRGFKPEHFQMFGTSNDLITTKLDLIAEKVGDLMPKRWREQSGETRARQ